MLRNLTYCSLYNRWNAIWRIIHLEQLVYLSMIEINGSIGHGQVLRTVVGLSALTLIPVHVTNIRKTRPRPGILAQHLAAIKIAGEFTNAKIKGNTIGSTDLEFMPRIHKFSNKTVNIGTAGSIPLLIQCLLPLMTFSDIPIELTIIGGTSGKGSPNIEYIKNVTIPIISLFGGTYSSRNHKTRLLP